VALAGVTVLTGCGLLPTEPAPRPRRIGYLAENCGGCPAGQPDGVSQAGFLAFRDALGRLGYESGTNLELELRVADAAQAVNYGERAAELIALRPDALVASGAAPAAALVEATTKLANGSIPVVFVNVGAPVEIGLVESLARPGRHVTGFASFSPALASKRLELLKEAAPAIVRPAAVSNPDDADERAELAVLKTVWAQYGLPLQPIEVRAPEDVTPSVAAAIRAGADAIVLASRLSPSSAASVAQRARVPSIGSAASLARSYGALMSYGPDVTDMYRRAAAQVDKILRGSSAVLPVEQPTKFELVVNLKTAEALGLTVPASVLAQATEIVQ
jgi:putative ABC transport system substrate-binding protein